MSSLVVKNPAPAIQCYPPGPRGHWLTGTVQRWRENSLKYLCELTQEYGDAVRFRFLLHWYGYIFSHPDHNKYVLQDNNHNFTKLPHPTFLLLQPLVGRGLLTNDGDSWLSQRRLIQPIFHRRRIAQFGAIMTEATEAMLDRWATTAGAGRPVDIDHEMTALTMEIVGKALFSIDLTGECDAVGQAFTAVNKQLAELNTRPFSVFLVRCLPFLPEVRRLMANIAVLDDVVGKIVQERRATGQKKDDLLDMLMEARDEETGQGMGDKQLRDEIMTLLLAGHETTANTLSWTFYLLSQHPEANQKLQAELATVLGGRSPTVDDLPNLTYTQMVVEEALRFYPPAYGIARTVVAEDEIGGYHVPAGSVVMLSPYLTHHHPDFWPDPERFDPERFRPEAVAARPRYAYIPFGGGPRQCIGSHFALTEAQLILATIAQRCRLELVPGHPVEPDPLITLRPKYGLPMRRLEIGD
ncbi:MAG: cytochrome P450 [Chloroflexi bacterium]|nr:cytochrome P450 [Chloroflexota bacterium]